MKLGFKTKMTITVLAFTVLGFILGCFAHSEFFHFFFNWLFE